MYSAQASMVGWDIGGAHLKFAALNAQGDLIASAQMPCPLWRGLNELTSAMQNALSRFGLHNAQHACTMTGELVDLFENRAQGVVQIAATVSQLLGDDTRFYAAGHGWLMADEVKVATKLVASTNWHASATWLALKAPNALLVDIGSTTTDIIVIKQNHVATQSLSDAERMRDSSLLYTGVVRTPLMALPRPWSFAGAHIEPAAEYFATTADIYRLLGELDANHDMAYTADGKGKSLLESARRLARMVGHDVEDKTLEVWRELAHTCKMMQMQQIQTAMLAHLQAGQVILGAGAGEFLVKQIAQRLKRDYLPAADGLGHNMQDTLCLPALAVAKLAMQKA